MSRDISYAYNSDIIPKSCFTPYNENKSSVDHFRGKTIKNKIGQRIQSFCRKSKIFQKSLVTPQRGHSCPVALKYGQQNVIPNSASSFITKT